MTEDRTDSPHHDPLADFDERDLRLAAYEEGLAAFVVVNQTYLTMCRRAVSWIAEETGLEPAEIRQALRGNLQLSQPAAKVRAARTLLQAERNTTT